jgi:hypothetical protein
MALGVAMQSSYVHGKQYGALLGNALSGLAGSAKASLLAQVSDAIADSHTALDTLRTILEAHHLYIDASNGVLAGIGAKTLHLNETAGYYRALAINMRIRAAVVPGGEANFGPMVVSTLQLAKDIEGKSSELKDMIFETSQNGHETAKSLGEEVKRLDAVLEQVGEQATQSQQQLHQLQSIAQASVDKLAMQGERLDSAFADLTVAVQFHDRLRQRVEHIQTLFEMAMALDVETQKWLCKVNHGQLADELFLLDQVKRQAREALVNLQELLENRLSISNSGSAGQGHDLQNLLSGLEYMMQVAGNEFKRSQVSSQDALELSNSFRNVSARIATHLQIVLDWKVESKLLSLNSVLIAGQLGNSGAGLRVLSKEIVKTSESLSTIVEELCAAASRINQEIETTHSLRHDIFDSALELVRTIRTHVDEALAMQDERALKKIRAGIAEAFSAMASLDTLYDGIQGLLGVMEPAQFNDAVVPADDALVSGIRSIYTMQAERNLFNLHCGALACESTVATIEESADDNIELF